MDMRFQGRAAIITGAASGMGLVASQEMAKEGAAVYMVDINEEGVTAAAQEICENGGKAYESFLIVFIRSCRGGRSPLL